MSWLFCQIKKLKLNIWNLFWNVFSPLHSKIILYMAEWKVPFDLPISLTFWGKGKGDLRNSSQVFLAISFCQHATKINYLHKQLNTGVMGVLPLMVKIVWNLLLKLWGRKREEGVQNYFRKCLKLGLVLFSNSKADECLFMFLSHGFELHPSYSCGYITCTHST